MKLDEIILLEHDSCDALTATILELPPALRREKVIDLRIGNVLWLPDDRPQHVYLLQTGKVEIRETSLSGKSVLLQTVKPGEIFGYLCFCGHRNEPIGTEARVAIPGTVRRTSYRDFSSAVAHSASVATRLTEALCSRLSSAERRNRILTIHNASRRLATLLHRLALAKQEQSATPPNIVPLYITHAELAAQASLTRPHTTVLMTRFRKLGYVAYGRGTAIQVHLKRAKLLLEE